MTLQMDPGESTANIVPINFKNISIVYPENKIKRRDATVQ